ncbi:hypothetical protein E2605_18965 [Dysgonomonas capnocytophagoides]|uniref:Phage tail protein n=1 Tax=Dysgonomonas capnocytophagoides TaxID=45254 RepID=A0A4Y8KU21_9BACT|nr:hypothetical protein [Dysgonomonas capnocytophagoides]TFD92187.1 hypothetical protein E2605_18965 [Dysgonomonas capnocytophagoides]
MAERSLAVGVGYAGFAEPGDGVAGTTYDQCNTIEENSVVFNFNDPTSVDFRAEGMDDPWESFDKAGDADSIDLNIPSPTAEEMKAYMGGTITGGKWEAPVERPVIRKSFKMQSRPYKGKYTEYIFPYCKVFAKLGQAPGSEQTDLLQIRVTKLTPITAAGVKKSAFSREVKEVPAEPEG